MKKIDGNIVIWWSEFLSPYYRLWFIYLIINRYLKKKTNHRHGITILLPAQTKITIVEILYNISEYSTNVFKTVKQGYTQTIHRKI